MQSNYTKYSFYVLSLPQNYAGMINAIILYTHKFSRQSQTLRKGGDGKRRVLTARGKMAELPKDETLVSSVFLFL
jgi:hypothetical protein